MISKIFKNRKVPTKEKLKDLTSHEQAIIDFSLTKTIAQLREEIKENERSNTPSWTAQHDLDIMLKARDILRDVFNH